VTERSLADIWRNSEAFRKYRGTDWMPEPCRSCERREIDWGGCRCQAFAIAGEAGATDPACALSPFHDALVGLAETESAAEGGDFVYRRFAHAERARAGSCRRNAAGRCQRSRHPGLDGRGTGATLP
jgi:pyrroloquinoline quinone biosynthesis protein E